jgi:hypothetical protein
MASRRLYITIIVTLTAIPAIAQTGAEDFVYLLPSKEIAETGEDLFFKAYLMDRQTMELSQQSKTLYLEIRSERDSLVWSEKYPIHDGRCDGHIYIGENWPQGEYFLEGYAKSSFTTDTTEALHPRRIRVVDNVGQMEGITAQAVRQDSLQRCTSKHSFNLFPEGGDLVESVTSVVAFKATYGNGFPEDVSGKVLENGQEIARIESLHDGMGQFVVTPQPGKKYEVMLDDGRLCPFPSIKHGGLSLRVTRNSVSGIDIQIFAPDDAPHAFSILAKLNGIPCGSAQGTVTGQKLVRLPKKLFPFQGIVELTLADGDGRPVAERLVYVNPEQRLTVTATPDQEHYALRDTGKVRIQVTDAAGNPVLAELAVSIFDKAYLYRPGHENILSHSYLSEQIRGNIFNPTYYFDEGNADRLQALDLLLMTQGWRRFVREESRPVLPDGITGRDLKHSLQFIQAFSPQSDTCMVMTDSLGRFEIDPIDIDRMRGSFYLKPFITRPKPKLVLENPFDNLDFLRQGRTRHLSQDYVFEQEREEVFYFDPDVTVLDEAKVSAHRIAIARDKVTGYLDSLAIMSTGAWVCDCVWEDKGIKGFLNDYNGYTHHPEGSFLATEYFGKGGKRMQPKRGHKYALIKLEYFPESRYGEVFVVSEVVPDFTYTGPEMSEEDLLEMNGMWKVQGYYPQREFYEPDAVDLSSAAPDYRNLLQWCPAVLTDENGVAEIPFSASDINTEFIGIIEAVDGTGLLGSQVFSFRVFR